ncbi:39S ribosomal protein L55, mitochondrial [Homalodisca vitripennis]|uniref:39S ribosomal protein L55, mitochondrial n=1 Tax=Homalodisca liturata TaxID=320908 RepID=A0A1B6IZZ2_9HEMI|nr:39S ribosomal protein L55, mitochondrial [Homalodisca vitripennis]XP_046673264.1 39S ribosomal protein L55, mitochondrial [Homalodisca vitripennis]XP_046673273.1 39S ribosomal protein L55, mitochondrial [Homalodisca vitripennis]
MFGAVIMRNLSSSSASITRIHRLKYLQHYPTTVVLPDGSSIIVRYPEPRKIITLPLDITALSESEAKIRLERRKPKTKVEIVEEERDTFSSKRYIKLMKKNKGK